jgi:hypothetical protein
MTDFLFRTSGNASPDLFIPPRLLTASTIYRMMLLCMSPNVAP